ncbi:MAG TPA: hypothetical protein DEB10_13350 [Ruminococcaceae bacterium]|mgnify:CR=1 FL=1|jgi:DNA-directed RNA polymerase specialized sigma subunit|nr:hypothetical protein [Oscillospiraceae bacterium]HCA30347.1 hypothetical protein [Oscillospiraceae bacterium]
MMTARAAALRQWIGRAKKIHDKLYPYEQAVRNLDGACGIDSICRERDRLRAKEAAARLELYDLLTNAVLPPRQFTILNLHYLQYESWTAIANKLNIERRYALQIHLQAIERLASQREINKGFLLGASP